MYYPRKAVNISIEDFEHILANLDSLAFLGESNLGHLRRVSTRLKQDNVTPVERGMIVRQVLNEALERLRGQGLRRDSGPDWTLYNLLYYRYFGKYHLKHEQVAARLEFSSTRHYFRERKRAIEALLNVVLEMEVAAQDSANLPT